jgi:hypothetical protein
MVLLHKEKVDSPIKGTIIDIETIGSFNNAFNSLDSRFYMNLKTVIFGSIDNESIQIHCAKQAESLEQLKKIIVNELDRLDKPFYAFNCNFERSIFFHTLNKVVPFDGELGRQLPNGKYEKKEYVVTDLKIEQHNDPFCGIGLKCSEAWQNGNLKDAIAHNRSCLLKERDILKKRGFRTPDPLNLVRV